MAKAAQSRSRGTGVMVGALIGCGWAFYATKALPSGRIVAEAAILVIAVLAIAAGRSMNRRWRAGPPPTEAQAAAGKRAWRLFWLNLVGEIVLLNLAVWFVYRIGRPDLLVPAISVGVGLHFVPLVFIFGVRSYWLTAGAMVLGAAVGIAAICDGCMSAAHVAAIEALANALILWASAGYGCWASRER